ncbi:MAG: hypothetical protein ACI4U2_01105, partial [Christensenellaceae bacterium]
MLYALFGVYLVISIFMVAVLIWRKMRVALAAYTAAFSVLLSFLVMYCCYDSMPAWGKLFVDTVGNFCSMMALLAVMVSLFLALSSFVIAVTAIEAYRSRKTN